MKWIGESKQYLIAAIISLLLVSLFYYLCLIPIGQAIESGILLFTALILVLYTKATQEMKTEMVNQTRSILAPSLVVNFSSFDAQHDDLTFDIFNYSSENIARNFSGVLFFDDKQIDSKHIKVIGFCGSNTTTYAKADSLHFKITKEHYENKSKLVLRYSYFDRTGKICFNDEPRCNIS